MIMKNRSLVIAMDEESLKQHVDALLIDGTVANHFKTKLGLQLSLAQTNSLLNKEKEDITPMIFFDEEIEENENSFQNFIKIQENSL